MSGWSQRIGRVALAAASGGLLAAAFPPLDRGELAWIALVPLLVAIRGRGTGASGALGWLTGAIGFGLVTPWVVTTFTDFTSIGRPAAILVHLSMVSILGAWVGAFAAGVAWGRARRLPVVWLAPAWWVTCEWLRGWVFIGFPWARLGASQHGFADLRQVAEVTGVWGLSALVVFGNVVVASFLWRDRRRPWGAAVALGVLLLVLPAVGQRRRVALAARAPAGTLRVALVQGRVAPHERRDAHRAERVWQRLVRASHEVAAAGPGLIVWPETATPFYFQDHPERVRRVVRELGVPVLFGTPARRRTAVDGLHRYNRAYLLDAAGAERGHYDKRVLVPFGEYVPYRWALPWVRPIVGQRDGMTPGTAATVLALPEARLGVLVCYEVIFPDLARSLVARDADVLVNVTNDAWIGGDVASAQSIAMAQLRAVENRVPLLRVTNSGPSAVIAPDGTVVWEGPSRRATSHVATLAWPGVRTVYTRFGDLVLWAAVATSVLALAVGLRRPAR